MSLNNGDDKDVRTTNLSSIDKHMKKKIDEHKQYNSNILYNFDIM